ncbi:MAG TPA: hypothetical protein VKY73_00535, partial [Polyangiaceae bacterium]|nr:hypothetical protein [Polyangiaceae bacterium]
DTGGYGTTTGSNLGNVSVAFYAKIAEGDEPASIPFPLDFDTFPEAPAGSVLSSKLLVFRKTSEVWSLNGTAANDKIGGDISLVFDSDPGVEAGDVVVVAVAVASFDFDSIDSYALSQNGVTFDTITEIDQFKNPLGWNLGGFLITAPVLAGASSGAPTLTASVAGPSTDVRGPGLFLRIAANNGGAGSSAAPAQQSTGSATSVVHVGGSSIAPAQVSTGTAVPVLATGGSSIAPAQQSTGAATSTVVAAGASTAAAQASTGSASSVVATAGSSVAPAQASAGIAVVFTPVEAERLPPERRVLVAPELRRLEVEATPRRLEVRPQLRRITA